MSLRFTRKRFLRDVSLAAAGAAVAAPLASEVATAKKKKPRGTRLKHGPNGDDTANIDAAIAAGREVYFGPGDWIYSGGRLTLPNYARIYGAGIGQTRLHASLSVGSDSAVRKMTVGYAKKSHYLRRGSSWTLFREVRFRASGAVRVWDMCDYTYWSSPVLVNRADFHHVEWDSCEFEYSGRSDCVYIECWPDLRANGGNVHDLGFYDCTFGARNASGAYSPIRVGILIQPSPPEHGTGGPRPGSSIDYDFDWSPITHGIGTPGEVTLRFVRCDVLGSASLASFDLCDNMRSYIMTTARNPDGTPKYTSGTNGTAEERAACPDKVCTHGVYFEDCRFADSYIPEIGRNCPGNEYPDHIGDNPVRYFARPEVVEHDAQLYGLGEET